MIGGSRKIALIHEWRGVFDMTKLAVIFMSIAVLSVLVLTVWCYYNILKPRGPDRDTLLPGKAESCIDPRIKVK
jgi:hypothetical protein